MSDENRPFPRNRGAPPREFETASRPVEVQHMFGEGEETDSEQPTVELYRCTECGYISTDIGWLHAHIERHRGLFGVQWPWRVADFGALMDRTEVLHVTEYETVPEPQFPNDEPLIEPLLERLRRWWP